MRGFYPSLLRRPSIGLQSTDGIDTIDPRVLRYPRWRSANGSDTRSRTRCGWRPKTHRAARHRGELSGLLDEARPGVGHRDADPRGHATRSTATAGVFAVPGACACSGFAASGLERPFAHLYETGGM